ncbi:GIY-YIG nuclease family protein [Halomonas sp. WWR20]
MSEASREPAEGVTAEEARAPQAVWYLYMIKTAAGALYTGITTDVERRFREHCNGKRGARALRGKGPLTLRHWQPVGSRSDALRLEAYIKTLDPAAKRAWIVEQQR